ncbi:hypothetical protein Cgig2_010626 [Carnegiea gigantea]|uniref:Uncharacterized protein n=1 Tax=Carnegiea gigantea TaxID=171969 RepID=A0A9Q1GW76_9CARY|nr:hypothetical protein Cgig2_010626 [Carnegiea gigantea]
MIIHTSSDGGFLPCELRTYPHGGQQLCSFGPGCVLPMTALFISLATGGAAIEFLSPLFHSPDYHKSLNKLHHRLGKIDVFSIVIPSRACTSARLKIFSMEGHVFIGNNRSEDVKWLCSLSESELDILISLKKLVLRLAEVVGHESLARAFDVKVLRAIGI